MYSGTRQWTSTPISPFQGSKTKKKIYLPKNTVKVSISTTGTVDKPGCDTTGVRASPNPRGLKGRGTYPTGIFPDLLLPFGAFPPPVSRFPLAVIYFQFYPAVGADSYLWKSWTLDIFSPIIP